MKLKATTYCNRLVLKSLIITAATAAPALGTSYTVTDLDPGVSLYPFAINSDGQIIGDSTIINTAPYQYGGTAFVWQPTAPNTATGNYSASSFGTSGAVRVAASAINSFGQVFGYYSTQPQGSASYQAFLFTPNAANGLVGSTTVLPFTNVASTSLEGGINDSGEIVASGGTNTTMFSPTTPRASTGTVTNFAAQNGEAFSGPAGISNSGDFTGSLYSPNTLRFEAGRFTPNIVDGNSGPYVGISDAGQGGTAYVGSGGGYCINSAGDVGGNGSSNANGGAVVALLWKSNGQVINLSTALGSFGQTALGINDADQVVGGASTAGSAFLYSGGQAYNLTSLVNNPNWTFSNATAINNQGQIVGTGFHNGVASAFLLTPTTSATTAQWIHNGSGDWNDASNWAGGIPDSVGAEADFFGVISSNQTVYTNLPVTASVVNFNNSNAYVVTGSSTLTLLANTGIAQVIVQSGTQELDLPVYAASNTIFNIFSGATLIVANPLTIIANQSLGQIGGGSVVYQSIVTLQSGAIWTIQGSAHTNALIGGPGSLATETASTSGHQNVLQLDSLTENGGTLDLNNNALVVDNGSLAATTALIASGFRSGLWTGTGIVSSVARTDTTHLTTIGVIQNQASNGNALYTVFENESVTAADILVKYTYYGDANLDGRVDGSDYSLIDVAYLADRINSSQYTGWYNGDFNYDGAIDGSDYTLIDNAFNRQGAVISSVVADPSADMTALVAGETPVPEPTSLLLLAASGLALLSRRIRA